MLIKCPECQNDISDKASSCPHCGLPRAYWVAEDTFKANTSTSSSSTQKTRKKANRHAKLPNGFGSIQKLSGKRRNPYAVYPAYKMEDYNDDGIPKRKKALGYFPNYQSAYLFLAEYNSGKKVGESHTLSEIYDKWFDRELANLPLSNSRRQAYKSAYKFCEGLYDTPIAEIHTDEIQDIIDNCGKGYSTKSNIKYLFNALFKYCISNALLTTNYASYVSVGKNTNHNGVPLSKEEISRLWGHQDDKDVQICLIYLYTGYRLQELKVCEIDLENRIMVGGVKNDTSRNRIVPIHHLIYDFVKDFDQKNFNPKKWREEQFKTVKTLCDFEFAPDGEPHTPHDFRHTFAMLCDLHGVDPVVKRMIMGHAKGNDISDKVYGHRPIEKLMEEIEKIPKECL